MSLTITVYGQPAPQGSKRHVGGGVMVESSKAVKPWREAVKWAVWDVLPMDDHGDGTADLRYPRLTTPLKVEVTFTLPKPASAPKTRRTWPQRKPDIDKLLRSTLDALSDAGVWVDDAQVVQLVARKVYPNEGTDGLGSPGAVIRIREVS